MAGIPDKDRGKARQLMLEEAEAIAAAHGFAALTITSLCDTTGFPPPQVRYHLRNTAHLRFAVLDALLLRLMNGLEQPEDLPAGEHLAGLCRAYATLRKAGAARHLHAVPWDSMTPPHRSALRHKQRLILHCFAEALHACHPDAGFAHAELLARSLLAMLDAYAAWPAEPGIPAAADYADMARRMTLAA